MINSINSAFNYFNFTELKYKISEACKQKLKYAYFAVPCVGVAGILYCAANGLDIDRAVTPTLVTGAAIAASHLFLAVKQSLDIHAVLKKGDIQSVKSLIEANPKLIYETDPAIGHNLLEAAISLKQKEVVECILKLDSSLANVRLTGNALPLHVALSCDENDEIVRLMLAHTRDIDALDLQNRTPLVVACQHGYFEIVELLIQKGARVDKSINGSNMSILHYQAASGRSNAVKMLISRGADVNAQDDHGYTPLHYACRNDNPTVAEILIENGARCDLKNRNGQTPRDLAHRRTLALLNKQAAQTDSCEFGSSD